MAMVPHRKAEFVASFNGALDRVRKHLVATNHDYYDPIKALEDAVDKVGPLVKIVTERRGRKNVQVPTMIRDRERTRIAVNWIMDGSKNQKGRLDERLAREIIGILNGDAPSLKKKAEVHKNALANRSNVLTMDLKIRKR